MKVSWNTLTYNVIDFSYTINVENGYISKHSKSIIGSIEKDWFINTFPIIRVVFMRLKQGYFDAKYLGFALAWF